VHNIHAYVLPCNEGNIPVCCKFTQLHSHQILLKSVNIWLSYCEKQKGETQCSFISIKHLHEIPTGKPSAGALNTDPDGVILGIRVRPLSWTPSWITPFCPTSGMSTQVFFQSPVGPLHESRVKIRGHMIAHRTPLIPRTISEVGRYWTRFSFKLCISLSRWGSDKRLFYTNIYYNKQCTTRVVLSNIVQTRLYIELC